MSAAQLTASNGSVQLDGELTFATVSGLFSKMHNLAGKGEMPGSIDLAGVTAIDSSGLALLLEWQANYNRSAGGWIRFTNPPAALVKIARLCDAETFLSPCENDAQATAQQQ